MHPLDAYKLVSKVFEGDVDRHGLPVVQHSLRVAKELRGDARVVALLHDVVEDTPITIEELKEKGGLTELQAQALHLVTRQKEETYRQFIDRIAIAGGEAGKIARQVKLADLQDNMTREELPETKSMIENRYQPAYDRLEALVKADEKT